MSKRQLLVLMLASGLIFTGAFAQAPSAGSQPAGSQPAAIGPGGPDPDQPKAESVLKHIPADCLGFFVISNLKDLLSRSEEFASQIGLGEMLQSFTPGGLLGTIAMPMGLGEGYNPNGGIAVIITDLEKSGIDVGEMFSSEGPSGDPPIVILLAGKSVETAFPNAIPGEAESVQIPLMGTMYTAQFGDYIALSPNPQALATMGKETLAISKKHADLLAKSDVSIYFNLKAAAQTIKDMLRGMEDAEKEAKETAGTEDETPPVVIRSSFGPVMMMQMTKMYSQYLDQMDGMTLGLRFVDTGLIAESLVDYKPTSVLGKLIASYTPTDKPMMNRLPNLPYVLAGGMVTGGIDSKTYVTESVKVLEMMLSMSDLEMPTDLRDRIMRLGIALGDEITSMQFVGGAPKDKGLFGIGMVIECKNAEKIKALLPEEAEILTELIQKTIGQTEEDISSLEFKYVKGVETVSGVTVDAIEVLHEELVELTDEKKADLIDVLGEDKVRFLVAQVDTKTLVVTLGGSKEFLAESIQAARNGGTIQSDPDVIKALEYLPKKNVSVMVFSAKNLFDTIQAGMKKMGEKSSLPEEFAFESKTPLVIGATVESSSEQVVFYIPAAMIKDIIKWIQNEIFSTPGMGLPFGPTPDGSDF